MFGGPIPVKNVQNYDGSPLFGPYLGMYFNFKLSDNFCLRPEISMAIKGVEYTAGYKRDTIVETEVNGQIGWIPTFYNVHISGDMSLVYLDVPVFLSYSIAGSTTLYIGCQSSFLLGGRHPVKIRVVVGEGGFYDDHLEERDSYNNVRGYDFGICIGGSQQLTEDLSFTFYGTRSFIPLYRAGTMQSEDIDTGNLYNTYFVGSVTYLF
ncbi:MAG: outer membrane beta-barrel protein [Ignavibacteriae bacterium]|nr:outer membrane beta-barrel protein [Ignavibacteriota bacterium]